MAAKILFLALTVLFSSVAMASDPSQLQDFCVADAKSNSKDTTPSIFFVNGLVCKDPKIVTVDDFSFSGLDKAGDTRNPARSKVTAVNVAQIPGLNTLGISLVRIDYAPNGINPPHTHPRATEVLVLLEGTLNVGFITSNPDNKLFSKVLKKGDVFVFPEGLIHFQFNSGNTNAVAIAGLSSQNPGVITIPNAVFGSKPMISTDILAKAFQVDSKTIDTLKRPVWPVI